MLVTSLVESLIEISQLKKFALINIHHTAESFDKIIEFIEVSESLEEIDLSQSIV